MSLPYETLLVTGGAGFVGSAMAAYFKRKYPNLQVIALDNLKRRGSELNVSRLQQLGVEFLHGDIRNPGDLLMGTRIGLMIECSAEPSVLAGYREDPTYVIHTNLTGTVNCLELARTHRADVVFLSTSRVYPYAAINDLMVVESGSRFEWAGEQGRVIPGWSTDGIDINFTLDGPRSLYGATKLASEIILREYGEMYGVRAVINRCGVIAGPGQFGKTDQGVFALWMLAHYFRRPLQYIGFGGTGKQVRDLLHVEDLCDLIDLQVSALDRASGKVYNVGGGMSSSLSLRETTEVCEDITGNRISIGSDPANRPADIGIYISDNRRATADFSWHPKRMPRDILADTCAWVRENEKVLAGYLGI